MKAGFKPKKFTAKEWRSNRPLSLKKCGVGKALDAWQRDCRYDISAMDHAAIMKAYKALAGLTKALDVALKNCDPKKQKTSIDGIGEYKKVIARYEGLLKDALKVAKAHKKFLDSLNLKSICKDSDALKVFCTFAQKKAFIWEALHSYLLWQKKDFEKAVKLYSNDGQNEGHYNISPAANTLLYNFFITKTIDDKSAVAKAIKKTESELIRMLDVPGVIGTLKKYPPFQDMLSARFAIEDFEI